MLQFLLLVGPGEEYFSGRFLGPGEGTFLAGPVGIFYGWGFGFVLVDALFEEEEFENVLLGVVAVGLRWAIFLGSSS